jgi:hypothetical protein
MPGLNDFLSRIQTDYEFYLQFRKSPQEALTPYELSAEERSALTGSCAMLWDYFRASVFPLGTSHNIVALGSDKVEFNADAALSQPEVQRSIAQINDSGPHPDKSSAILGLVEQIG